MNLLQVRDDDFATIKSIPDDEAGQRLEALGLRVGKRIKRISGMPFEGPVTVMLDGRHFAVAHSVALHLEVEGPEAPEHEDGEPDERNIWSRFL